MGGAGVGWGVHWRGAKECCTASNDFVSFLTALVYRLLTVYQFTVYSILTVYQFTVYRQFPSLSSSDSLSSTDSLPFPDS